MRTRPLLAILPLAALTACSAQTHGFDSATELRSAAVNAGLHCTGYNPITPPEGAKSAGECVGGTPATLVVYADDSTAEKGITAARAALKNEQAVLAGTNWYVLSGRSDVEGIKGAIGGDVQGPVTS